MTDNQRWTIVVLYAAAMAWVESAVVFYLRTLVDRVDPYQPNPIPVEVGLIRIELIREAATLLMLVAVGWLAGRTTRSRFGYFLLAFGVWDILYYVFLAPISGWPRSLFNWDVLFLLPLPWWGPVLAPVSIAGLMVVGGTLLSRADAPEATLWPGRWPWRLSLAGAGLALYAFMADALHALPDGVDAVLTVRPTWFNWPLFILALLLMAAPILDLLHQQRTRRTTRSRP